jgi:hypothetical protein
LIVLNRGSPNGELNPTVTRLIEEAIAGKDVSAVRDGRERLRNDIESATSNANAGAEDGKLDDDSHGHDGPDSQLEIERKLTRLEELERERQIHESQRIGWESEVAELKAKLAPETPIHHQQRLFRQAIRALQKAETAGTLEKERRSLKGHAALDLVELVRSAIRDGLNPDRLDLVYRPELH